MRRDLTPERRLRSARLRAVLAGGLVLGVGTTATLAAWTDEEHATETFTAGTFSIVGSTNGADFSDHPSMPGAALNFTVTPTAMAPGTTVYALYSVKTTVASVGGSVRLMADDPGNGSGLGAYLEYGVTTIAGITCNAGAFSAGTPVVATESKLTTGAAAKNTLAASGASPINYCFAVTLPTIAPNEAQGAELTARWTFAATTDPAGP